MKFRQPPGDDLHDPYEPPRTLIIDSQFVPVAVGTMDSFKVIAWVLWILLFVSLLWSALVVVGAGGSDFSGGSARSLGFLAIGTGQSMMVLVVRWIFLRFMLKGTTYRSRKAVVRCVIGVVLIYGMVKVVEFEGYWLWRQNGSISQFLVFALPSYVLALVMMPTRLLGYISESFVRQEPSAHSAAHGSDLT